MRLVQKAALVFGIAFISVALLGFFTAGGMSMHAEMGTAAMLLGLFPVNAAHNAVHLSLGVWGVLAARDYLNAKRYCQYSGGLYLILAGVGLVVPDTFGYIPIGGNDIALHAVLGLVLTIVGFATADAPATGASTSR
ncbi:MAG TPA: DUF4383 domain-containing protein [Gemmatimonadaceae bacterium]|nr:DUF4383 domain-containing protein [Gemmatimonadaceae bacterium]